MWLTYEIELSLQSRAHFIGLIFKKWSGTVSFFYDFSCEIELSLQPRAHFVDHFPDLGAQTAETDILPAATMDAATLPEKTQGFAPSQCFSRESLIRSQSLILDDDMIDMMMWLI